MRMRELETRSGVGRETIRFYIREGLLPEPERASRNSAVYGEAHVARLKAIKALQEQRYLPLAVIRSLLSEVDQGRAAEAWLAPEAFPQLDAMLRDRFDTDSARLPVDALAAQLGVTRADLIEHAEDGIIAIGADDALSARDAAIMRLLGQLRAAGFTDARGFGRENVRMYRDFVEWLTAAEMKLFFGQTAGRIGEAEAADMAAKGLSTINELLGLLRTRALLDKLAHRRRIANDNAA